MNMLIKEHIYIPNESKKEELNDEGEIHGRAILPIKSSNKINKRESKNNIKRVEEELGCVY